MSRPIGSDRTIVGTGLLFVTLLCAPPHAAATVPAPTQWIAKQYTEVLGRAPTAGEWNFWYTYYSGSTIPCDATTLAVLGKAALKSPEFTALYPTDKAARVIAMVRAVYNRDPFTQDWNNFYVPYANGTYTWEQTVDRIYTLGNVFNFYFVPYICSTTSATYGFGNQPPVSPLDVRALTGGGASRTHQQLQAAIDAASPGETVWLAPQERVLIGGFWNGNQGLRVKAGVTLATSGQPNAQHYAQMGRLVPAGFICNGFLCSHTAVVTLEPGASLKHVWVDGLGQSKYNWAIANVEARGSSGPDRTLITDNRFSDPGRSGTAIRALGRAVTNAVCGTEFIERNLITGYRSTHAQDSRGQPLWASGISVFCESANVRDNAIVDISNTGIMLYGNWNRDDNVATIQNSTVINNTVFNAGNHALAAFGADSIGECYSVRQGEIVPCLDRCIYSGYAPLSFAGSSVSANTFWTSPRTQFDVGLLIGSKTFWGDHGCYGTGAAFTNNTAVAGTRVNVGIAVMGMHDVTLTGNTSTYALIDGNPAISELECPLVNVGVGSAAEASVLAGAQPHTGNLDSLKGCLLPPPPAGGLERIDIHSSGDYFVGATSGEPFTPWGMNWDGGSGHFSATGWPEMIRGLRNMRRMGVNVVRFLLQYNNFVNAPTTGSPDGVPNMTALLYLARMVTFAEQLGMYVDITGLGIQNLADQPAWYDDRTEAQRWAAQRVFWSSVAAWVGGSRAVMFYDLMNEPAVNGVQPNWYAGAAGAGHYVQYLTRDQAGRDRRTIVRDWITQMTDAIRNVGGDMQHPITLGVQPVASFGLPAGEFYDLLDFIALHKYVWTPACDAQASIDNAATYKYPGMPLLVEETSNFPCLGVVLEEFVFGSRAEAQVSGWLGFYTLIPPEPFFGPDFITTFMRDAPGLNPAGTGIALP